MAEMRLVFCFSPAPGEAQETTLSLPADCTVQQALQAATQALPEWAELIGAAEPEMLGVWSKRVPMTHTLQPGDRLELYRPLTVDPKVARRERFAQQGARTSGLFKRKRPGAKAGY